MATTCLDIDHGNTHTHRNLLRTLIVQCARQYAFRLFSTAFRKTEVSLQAEAVL